MDIKRNQEVGNKKEDIFTQSNPEIKNRKKLKKGFLIGSSILVLLSIYGSLFIFGTNYDIDIDPELKPSTRFIPNTVITRNNLFLVRTVMKVRNLLTDGGKTFEDVAVTKNIINSEDGDVGLYIYEKKTDSSQKPGMLWIHGGGYILGEADDDFAAKFADELDMVVISVDYRLAPENPFPAGLNDCYAALLWMVENAQELGIDKNLIAVGGSSAGGGLAAGLLLYNRDQKGPEVAFQFLLAPMLDNLHDTPSGNIENYPVWNRKTSFNAWEMYLDGTPGKDASPYASATRAEDVSGLPRTYIGVGSADLFKDESIDYARRLQDAGVSAEIYVFPGLFHSGEGLMPEAEVSKRFIKSRMDALKNALYF